MTALTVALLSINGAGLLAVTVLFVWSKRIGGKPETIPEAAVRGLYLLARWFRGLAEAADSAVIAYREIHNYGLLAPRCEVERQLRTMKLARDLERELERFAGEERGSVDSIVYLYVLAAIAAVVACTLMGAEVREAWLANSAAFERIVR